MKGICFSLLFLPFLSLGLLTNPPVDIVNSTTVSRKTGRATTLLHANPVPLPTGISTSITKSLKKTVPIIKEKKRAEKRASEQSSVFWGFLNLSHSPSTYNTYNDNSSLPHSTMDYRFPGHISAARVAAFVSTAAWIQGTSASAVSLPPDALHNFLRRHEISGRQAAPAATTPATPAEEEESVSEESDDDDPSSADASSVSEGEGGAGLTGAQGQSAGVDGQPGIQSSGGGGTRLSPGAQAAIGIWVAVAVLAIGALVFFFFRRRRRARELQEIRSLRDMEIASYQALSEKGGGVGGPPPPGMEPVHFREGPVPSRAPSGQWMATPPWQEEPPTWRESRPWRQSGPSVAPNGLPLHQNAGFGGMPPGRPEFDRRTEVTAETESTIFAYR
ncbi:hypothetical protein F4775DRAFT_538175 [Biscogniauxia sp. FL1348]|nr:hypothetical protein F4775DRAFT_538175 [Biscogniauxia sp. FL1348]